MSSPYPPHGAHARMGDGRSHPRNHHGPLGRGRDRGCRGVPDRPTSRGPHTGWGRTGVVPTPRPPARSMSTPGTTHDPDASRDFEGPSSGVSAESQRDRCCREGRDLRGRGSQEHTSPVTGNSVSTEGTACPSGPGRSPTHPPKMDSGWVRKGSWSSPRTPTSRSSQLPTPTFPCLATPPRI